MRLYQSLCKIFKEINNINNITSLLEWDAQVIMSTEITDDRARQINTLSGIKHNILTNSTVTNLIQELIKQRSKLSSLEKSDLSHMERMHSNARIVPIDLLYAFNTACIASQDSWRKAREENKFKDWLPKLQEVVNLARKIATVKAEFLGCSKYEALLENYEVDLSIANINSIFTEVGKFLRDFIGTTIDQQPKIKTKFNSTFSLEKQRELGQTAINLIKLKKNNIHLHESIHPFTTGNQFDTRITTAYNEKDFTQGFMSTLHESGHALYNLNLPLDLYGRLVGGSLGMAMHEAQALLFEKHIGSSFEFISYMTPLFKKILQGKSWSAQNVYNFINKVNPSPIRIYADEVTYPTHIMVRYTLEKAMLEGELQVKDLPSAWEEDMKYYLNITPKNDAEGCMQDIHWASGQFGYFPSYLLGLVIAAQLFAKIKEQIPDVMEQIESGNLEEVIKWLTENIYKHGKVYNMQEIMRISVGKELDPKYYISYLQNKYSGQD